MEETDALMTIEKHRKNIDNLVSYDGLVSVDNESYSTDVLKLMYAEALDNVCSTAIIDLLASLDYPKVRDGIVSNVLLDISISQHKKTEFMSLLKKAMKSDSSLDSPARLAAFMGKVSAVQVGKILSQLFKILLRVFQNRLTDRLLRPDVNGKERIDHGSLSFL